MLFDSCYISRSTYGDIITEKVVENITGAMKLNIVNGDLFYYGENL